MSRNIDIPCGKMGKQWERTWNPTFLHMIYVSQLDTILFFQKKDWNTEGEQREGKQNKSCLRIQVQGDMSL